MRLSNSIVKAGIIKNLSGSRFSCPMRGSLYCVGPRHLQQRHCRATIHRHRELNRKWGETHAVFPYGDPRDGETAMNTATDQDRHVLARPIIGTPGHDRFSVDQSNRIQLPRRYGICRLQDYSEPSTPPFPDGWPTFAHALSEIAN
jgi:hypothetical protein